MSPRFAVVLTMSALTAASLTAQGGARAVTIEWPRFLAAGETEPGEIEPLSPRPASAFPVQAGREQLPHFDVQLRFGGGNFEHDTDNSGLDGDTGAGYFALQFEGFSDRGFGGGLRLEGIATDDDLFTDIGAPDTEASSGELFLYFGYRVASEGFRMPMRTGLVLNGYTLEDNASNEEIDYATIGLRFEVEPEIELAGGQSSRWSLYALGSLGFGTTEIDTEPATFEADADTFLYGFDLGTRVQLGPVLLGLGYVLRGSVIDDSDVVGGFFFRGIDTVFSGLQFTIGGRF